MGFILFLPHLVLVIHILIPQEDIDDVNSRLLSLIIDGIGTVVVVLNSVRNDIEERILNHNIEKITT